MDVIGYFVFEFDSIVFTSLAFLIRFLNLMCNQLRAMRRWHWCGWTCIFNISFLAFKA